MGAVLRPIEKPLVREIQVPDFEDDEKEENSSLDEEVEQDDMEGDEDEALEMKPGDESDEHDNDDVEQEDNEDIEAEVKENDVETQESASVEESDEDQMDKNNQTKKKRTVGKPESDYYRYLVKTQNSTLCTLI